MVLYERGFSVLLQLTKADQIVGDLRCTVQHVGNGMRSIRYAYLRFRAGDMVEPILADGDGGAAILATEHQVHVCCGEVVRCPRRFRAIAQEEVQSSRRERAATGRR